MTHPCGYPGCYNNECTEDCAPGECSVCHKRYCCHHGYLYPKCLKYGSVTDLPRKICILCILNKGMAEIIVSEIKYCDECEEPLGKKELESTCHNCGSAYCLEHYEEMKPCGRCHKMTCTSCKFMHSFDGELGTICIKCISTEHPDCKDCEECDNPCGIHEKDGKMLCGDCYY